MADKDSPAAAVAGAMMPIGCLMGLVAALFWLVMLGFVLFCAWILTLPSPPK